MFGIGPIELLILLLTIGIPISFVLIRKARVKSGAQEDSAPVAGVTCCNCGQINAAGHKFCRKCGKPLEL